MIDTPTPPAGKLKGPRPPRPWYALVAGQWPLFVTLVGVFIGVLIVASSHWRRGTTAIGLTLIVAAFLRLLPDQTPGLLIVRSKWIDFAVLLTLGLGITTLAWVVSPSRA